MKPIKAILTITVMVFVSTAYSQRPLRGDVCQQIPDLTKEQKQKINKLSLAHQQTMDALRTKFWAETDAVKASEIRSQMNSERVTHYRDVSALLTPQQQTWFNKTCSANASRGYVRGMGYGRSMGYGRCTGYYGQGAAYGRGMGRGRGTGRFPCPATDIP